MMANYYFLFNCIAYFGFHYDSSYVKTWPAVTIIIIFNAFYFLHKKRFKTINRYFLEIDPLKKKKLNIITTIYMVISVFCVAWVTFVI